MILESKTILFLVTEDWYFCSHRLPIARAARNAGAKIIVATRLNECKEQIEKEGFQTHNIPFYRTGKNPVLDLFTVIAIIRCYLKHKPSLVHHVALKPILYGQLALLFVKKPAIVNAMTGMGYIYIAQSIYARFIRKIFEAVTLHFSKRTGFALILQNHDDHAYFEQLGMATTKLKVIKGSGVDIKKYLPSEEPDTSPVVVCVSRMLFDKGIAELVEAARILHDRKVKVEIKLVGPTDANPTSIPIEKLNQWHADGLVNYIGYSDNISEIYRDSHIAILPSYHEGLPKSLIEAAAAGRPIITTNVPGCREICNDNENGILVPAKDPNALADAIELLAKEKSLRRIMGEKSRSFVEAEFDEEIIAKQTINLYFDLLQKAA